MEKCLDNAKNALDSYYMKCKSAGDDHEIIKLAKNYFNWISKKTNIISNEKEFTIPEDIKIKRGSVFWVDFGYNIDQEMGGRHPAIVLRTGGNTAIVVPLSTKEPSKKYIDSGICVKIGKVWGFANMDRWVNVLNTTPISIQRFDFDSSFGNVKGKDLDNIREGMKKSGLWNR